jgi:hypothetical protein
MLYGSCSIIYEEDLIQKTLSSNYTSPVVNSCSLNFSNDLLIFSKKTRETSLTDKDLDELFDSFIETAEILADKDLMKSLNKSIKQIERGEVVPWEDVLKKLK